MAAASGKYKVLHGMVGVHLRGTVVEANQFGAGTDDKEREAHLARLVELGAIRQATAADEGPQPDPATAGLSAATVDRLASLDAQLQQATALAGDLAERARAAQAAAVHAANAPYATIEDPAQKEFEEGLIKEKEAKLKAVQKRCEELSKVAGAAGSAGQHPSHGKTPPPAPTPTSKK